MKKRLDLILFELGYFETKNKAQSAILAGDVKIGTNIVSKAGEMYDFDVFKNEITKDLHIEHEKYVSRGGLKLEGAIKHFNIDLKDRVCIDIGASTGGFTDCMLFYGAKFVYSVDVGTNQMAWKLKTDKRVKNLEHINAKNCKFEDIFDENDELPNFLSMDVSFISIKKVLANVINFTHSNSEYVLLIKPQFEAKRNEILKGGIVKDIKIHERIINEIKDFCNSLNLEVKGVVESPIIGNKSGNTEYLIYLKRGNI